VKPSLIGILERSRERGHYLPTITQITPNLRPFLELTHLLKAASCFDRLLELVQIQWSLIDTWEPGQAGALGSMELCE